MVAAAIAAGANAEQSLTLDSISTSAAAPIDAVPAQMPTDDIQVLLKKYGLKGELSAADMALLKGKENALFQHLYEQQQLKEIRSILDAEQRKDGLEKTKQAKYPLNPEEIVLFRKLAREMDEAANAPIASVEFKISTIEIDTDAPNPIQIMVAKGYSSSIMFFDQAGAPWPIEGDIIGDGNSFTSHPIEGKPHVGVFEIKRSFSESNALVNLKGLNVPVVVRLTGSESTVDARKSVRIPKFGPETSASPQMHRELDDASSPDMLAILNGDMVDGAKRYALRGVPGTVFHKDGALFIRTQANLISPPFKAYVSSPTGYRVYQLPPVTNLLFTVNGEMAHATVERGFEVKIKQANTIFQD